MPTIGASAKEDVVPCRIGESVLVLIDEACVAYFAGTARTFGRRTDWLSQREVLANPVEDRSS